MRDAPTAAPFRLKEFDLIVNRAPRPPVLEGKHCAVAAPVGAVYCPPGNWAAD
jgi:hypothetical protein